MIIKIFNQKQIKKNLIHQLENFEIENTFEMNDLILKTFENKNFIILQDSYLEKNKEEYIKFIMNYEKRFYQI